MAGTMHAPLAALAAQLRPHLRTCRAGFAADDALIRLAASGRFALIGEASHGTHEFYFERAELTKRLIVEHGFTGVVAEADWPDAWRVNRYVRDLGDDAGAEEALCGFERFPTWMWRNTVVRDFAEWLREYNAKRPPSQQCGFYGMDLYSMHASMRAVLDYLDRVDPEAAQRARYRYACFEHSGEDSQAYGYAASFGMKPSCEDEVIAQLREMTRRNADLLAPSGEDRDEAFFAQQNARLVRNAEEYYRTMFHGRVSSWNLRDSHMMETLQALEKHLAATRGAQPKLVVWAHNSHLGDASATEMGDQGEWNVGQLARDRWGADAVLVGFSTYGGTVTAASEWDSPGLRRRVRPGLAGSYEALFHDCGEERFWIDLRDGGRRSGGSLPPAASASGRPGGAAKLLSAPMLERAIGVIYQPQTERLSHYFDARLSQQFDAILHIDETRALEPLVPEPQWHSEEAPETYPSGL